MLLAGSAEEAAHFDALRASIKQVCMITSLPLQEKYKDMLENGVKSPAAYSVLMQVGCTGCAC